MVPLAEAFWKEPNVYDAVGVLGLVIGFYSVWLAIRIAKRDIQKQLAEAADRAERAAREEVRRVARLLLQSGLTSAIRSLELAREVCNVKRWVRAPELCLSANEHLARAVVQPSLDEASRAEVRGVSAALQNCVTRLRGKRADGAGDAPEGVAVALDGAILALHRIEGRLTAIQLEGEREREIP